MATKQCSVCGKDFVPCNSCDKNIDEALQWRRVVCCSEHFAYHLPIIMYVRGIKTKEEAGKELKTAIENYGEIAFCDNINPTVKELLKEAPEKPADDKYEKRSSRRSSRYRS